MTVWVRMKANQLILDSTKTAENAYFGMFAHLHLDADDG